MTHLKMGLRGGLRGAGNFGGSGVLQAGCGWSAWWFAVGAAWVELVGGDSLPRFYTKGGVSLFYCAWAPDIFGNTQFNSANRFRGVFCRDDWVELDRFCELIGGRLLLLGQVLGQIGETTFRNEHACELRVMSFRFFFVRT
jgi:hypothetical protein